MTLKHVNYFTSLVALLCALFLSQVFARDTVGHFICWIIFFAMIPVCFSAGVRMGMGK